MFVCCNIFIICVFLILEGIASCYRLIILMGFQVMSNGHKMFGHQ